MATEEIAADLRAQGLRPTGPDAAPLKCFAMAARYLAKVPLLEAELRRLVYEVTLLEADPGYDVSHSEPRWPFAIFVSAAPATDRDAALRLLENVVHEGMHLRLTEIERNRPLVQTGAERTFSPWMRQERDAQGVLHGVYVFTCISALFARRELLAEVDDQGRRYGSRRRTEIAAELQMVDLDALGRGLTGDGRRFLSALLDPPGAPDPWTLTPP